MSTAATRRRGLILILVSAFVVGFSSSFVPPTKVVLSNKRRNDAKAASVELHMSSPAIAVGSLLTKTVRQKIPVVAAATAVAVFGLRKALDKPSRTYGEGTVAKEYDAWTQDGILEYYWGEHIHLGYYNEKEMAAGWRKKNFIEAKFDFVDQMMGFGSIDTFAAEKSPASEQQQQLKVLDVGCGVGGTSRYLAKKLPAAQVTGITLSPNQVKRATELAAEQKVPNANFTVMNALKMDFPDNSFDIVWACESGEHMPDKKAYIEEMMRVLKPGGKFVMATWCQRDDREKAFTKKDKRDLKFLYEEWTHPYFISIEAYAELMEATGKVDAKTITTADWVKETIASWRHSVVVGLEDPRGWIFKPRAYWKCVRDAYCLERMHRAFDRGLMQYGMFAATKKV
mmetsp:Transcript_13387/g.19700  ORF Transcript_13387/g.19700 Transcript_13387/m.19700 type:complete len:398 (-) Transcript_13387:86-1279(-)